MLGTAYPAAQLHISVVEDPRLHRFEDLVTGKTNNSRSDLIDLVEGHTAEKSECI